MPGSRLVPVVIPGPTGALEGLLQETDRGEPPLAALICHPHPLYGGTMHNKVVHTVAAALHSLGAATLRFNFRGAGRSAGAFDQGVGELEDARAALAFLRERHGTSRIWVAGFSFGAWIVARLAATEREIERLILVAPPVGTVRFEEMRTSPVSKLVLQGANDDICPLDALERELPDWAGPKTLVTIAGASHFFDRQLDALSQAMVQALSSPAAGPASETT